jgi:hypothetical protein
MGANVLKTKSTFLLIAACVISGCATYLGPSSADVAAKNKLLDEQFAEKANRTEAANKAVAALRVGMTRAEVLALLGEPRDQSTNESQTIEYRTVGTKPMVFIYSTADTKLTNWHDDLLESERQRYSDSLAEQKLEQQRRDVANERRRSKRAIGAGLKSFGDSLQKSSASPAN